MTQTALFAHAKRTQSEPPTHPYEWVTAGGWRQARLANCRTCKSVTVQGSDETHGASTAHADPAPLTALGEALALLGGRRTLMATRDGHTLTLTARVAHVIEGHPAESTTLTFDVLPEHQCHSNPLPTTTSRIRPLTESQPPPETPPPF